MEDELEELAQSFFDRSPQDVYKRQLFDTGVKPGDFDGIGGDVQLLRSVEMIDQNPIGKSSRSNPVTYILSLIHIWWKQGTAI